MQQKLIQRLKCQAQKYAWGMLSNNPNCLVYQLTTIKDNALSPYAELWMGSHPSLPSLQENGEKLLLPLPYLFKVLSVDQPLSIQIHPNKAQAQLLHATKPNLYPDDNHKPEMAIALTDFEALVGFADQQIIVQNIENNPHLLKQINPQIWDNFKNTDNQQAEHFLKLIVEQFLSFTEQDLVPILDNYVWPLNCNKSLNPGNKIQNYDVGYLFLLIMNHLVLEPGQAIVLEAGLIHAYLKGNIIEAMANSDNVVRCGFTPKQKDIETMKEILLCSMKKPEFVKPTINEGQNFKHLQYNTQYDEFACEYYEITATTEQEFTIPKNTILLCLQGQGWILQNDEKIKLEFGNTLLIVDTVKIVFEVLSPIKIYLCHQKN